MKKSTSITLVVLILSALFITGCHHQTKTEAPKAKPKSLYARLGGQPAIDAAVDIFYKKVLADKRVNHFFEDVNMNKQIKKQKAFLAAAFGGPNPWTGKDMRKAHKNLDLKEKDFAVIAEHLVASLKELKVPQNLIDEVVAIAVSTKKDVLNQ